MRMMPIVTTFVLLAAGFAQAGQQSPAFKGIDADADGYVSQTEAAGNSDLSNRWVELDKDTNNMLDISEFSAFETGAAEENTKQAPDAPSTPCS